MFAAATLYLVSTFIWSLPYWPTVVLLIISIILRRGGRPARPRVPSLRNMPNAQENDPNHR